MNNNNNQCKCGNDHQCNCNNHNNDNEHHQCGCNHHDPKTDLMNSNNIEELNINSPEVLGYLSKPYTKVLRNNGTKENPIYFMEVLEFDDLWSTGKDKDDVINKLITNIKTRIARLLREGLRVPEPGEIPEHKLNKTQESKFEKMIEEAVTSQLNLKLSKVNDKSWIFGNSGFGLIYESEPNEYYMIDFVDGEADDGEAVNVFKFPNSTKTQEQELEGIQEWFDIFYYGFSYAYTKQNRLQEKIYPEFEKILSEI